MVEGLISRFSREIPSCRFGYWRTLAGAEVDFVVEHSGKVLPIEVKLHTSPVASDLRGLSNCIADLECETGIVLHGGDKTYEIGSKILAIPASEMLLGTVGLP